MIFMKTQFPKNTKINETIDSLINRALDLDLPIENALIFALGGKERRRGGCWSEDHFMPYVEIENKKFYIRKDVKKLYLLQAVKSHQINNGYGGPVIQEERKNLVLYSTTNEMIVIIQPLGDRPRAYEIEKVEILSIDNNDRAQDFGADALPCADSFKSPVVVKELVCGPGSFREEDGKLKYYDINHNEVNIPEMPN